MHARFAMPSSREHIYFYNNYNRLKNSMPMVRILPVRQERARH
jgi:hypothetical protein